ncbi:MAG: SDR family oxidoreductase [Christensenella sp.]
MKLLENKTAVITGCNRGIGKAILETFAKNGANIFACIRKQSQAFDDLVLDLSTKYDVQITPVYFDLSDIEQIKAGFKTIMASKQAVDILVNNAGITSNFLLQMTTYAELENVLQIDFVGPVMFAQSITKLMTRYKNGGNVINIASTAGLDANAGRTAYGSAKAALICATKVLATELGAQGIRANAIAPGMTNTEMVESNMTQKNIDETIANTKLKRMAVPADIANAALFLASDLSSYVTGQVLRVDGGLIR